MTRQQNISTYISRTAISLILLATTLLPAGAQNKTFTIQNDSVPLFNGFAVSFDLVGPAMQALGDYGEFEAALRINLHDQYFPIF